MDLTNIGKPILVALLMLIASLGLGFGVSQSSFPFIALYYGLFFGAYFWCIKAVDKLSLNFWLATALFLRIILLFSFPALSDDIYRFVWDGRLWLSGHNPFDHLPSWYMTNEHNVSGLSQALFDELNSPDYYTIYPPVAQLSFVIATFIGGEHIGLISIIMKLFLLAADIGSIWLIIQLLKQWNLPINRVLFFALNPLLIVELMGNLHFEGVMIFFLLLAIYWLTQERWYASASAMAMAISAKLLPLMFLPFLIKRLGWKRSFTYFTVLGLVLIASWIPLLSQDFIQNFGNSLDLYYRRFEFNASFYYLMRWWGYFVEGHNLIATIGPLMALVVLLVILLRAYNDKGQAWQELPALFLFAISFYLAYATTIHPWYTALPIVLCLFTPWRWPLLWSGLIWLTYINYSYTDGYHENLWIVAIEYSIVIAYGYWESKQMKRA